jgi:hypothetical protein
VERLFKGEAYRLTGYGIKKKGREIFNFAPFRVCQKNVDFFTT